MLRQRIHSEAGFSLLELIVAIAILAILSAAVAPLVIQYVGDSRFARTQSDAQAFCVALNNFRVDTGRWPVSNDGDLTNANEISRLVSRGVAPPAPCAGAVAGQGWDDLGAAEPLEDYLISNDNGVQLYPPSANPLVTPGWRGPYVPNTPLDAWGNPYVANVRHLDGTGIAAAADEADHAVFVLSAGANGCWDTDLQDGVALPTTGIAGDDLGCVIEGNTQ